MCAGLVAGLGRGLNQKCRFATFYAGTEMRIFSGVDGWYEVEQVLPYR